MTTMMAIINEVVVFIKELLRLNNIGFVRMRRLEMLAIYLMSRFNFNHRKRVLNGYDTNQNTNNQKFE
jgi:hypothetical protein